MPDLFTVSGTTFRFPSLPPEGEMAPDLFERLHGSRADVLAKAAKAKHTPAKSTGKPYPRTKPGNGEFTPKPGAPGGVITVDGRDFEVWSMGPGSGTRWVTHAGRFFLLRGTKHASVEPNPAEVLADGVTYEWVASRWGGGVRAIVTKAEVDWRPRWAGAAR